MLDIYTTCPNCGCYVECSKTIQKVDLDTFAQYLNELRRSLPNRYKTK